VIGSELGKEDCLRESFAVLTGGSGCASDDKLVFASPKDSIILSGHTPVTGSGSGCDSGSVNKSVPDEDDRLGMFDGFQQTSCSVGASKNNPTIVSAAAADGLDFAVGSGLVSTGECCEVDEGDDSEDDPDEEDNQVCCLLLCCGAVCASFL
jgi:hypothetical protein